MLKDYILDLKDLILDIKDLKIEKTLKNRKTGKNALKSRL